MGVIFVPELFLFWTYFDVESCKRIETWGVSVLKVASNILIYLSTVPGIGKFVNEGEVVFLRERNAEVLMNFP